MVATLQLFFLMVILVIGGCEPSPQIPQVKDQSVTIGFMAPLTGDNAFRGQQALEGLNQFFKKSDDVPEWLSVNIKALDVHDISESAIKSLEHLSSDPKLLMVVSFNSSDALMAVNQEADKLGIPFLAAVATHPGIAKGTAFMNQFLFDDVFQGEVSALFVRDELLFSRVAIVSTPSRKYSKFLSHEFDEQFQLMGGEITTHFKIDNKGEGLEIKSTLESLKKGDPELIYLPVDYKISEGFLIALSSMDWSPSVMVSDGVLDSLLEDMEHKHDRLEGAFSVDVYSVGMPLAENTVIRRSHFRKQSDSLNTFKVLGVEAGMLINRSIIECQKTDLTRDCINKAIRNTQNMPGLTGLISMGGDGKAQRPVIVSQYIDGKVKFLVKVY